MSLPLESTDLVRAWTDGEYLAQLPDAVRQVLPPAPAGVETMSDEELREAAGGWGTLSTWVASTGVLTAIGGASLGITAAIDASKTNNNNDGG